MPDLPNVPYHQQDYPSYCGAACAQMVLKSLTPSGQPAIGQYDLYSRHLNNSSDSLVQWGMAPDELANVLNDFKPVTFGGVFRLAPCASEVEVSRQITFLISKGEPPPIALIYGMRHWLVVRGYDADRQPNSATDNINIFAFYVNNPWPPLKYSNAIPQNHVDGDVCGTGFGQGGSAGCPDFRIPYSVWQSDYMTGIPGQLISRSNWAGLFLAVVDPSEPDEAARPEKPGHNSASDQGASFSYQEPILPGTPAGSSDWPPPRLISPERAKDSALSSLQDPSLREREPWKSLLEGDFRTGNPHLVQRLDHADRFYYICPVRLPGQERAAIAVSVDAITGEHREAVAMRKQDQISVPNFSGRNALERVMNRKFDIGPGLDPIFVRPEGVSLYRSLVWKPCAESFSPFQPFHMILAGPHRLYVSVTGQVFTELHDNVAGF